MAYTGPHQVPFQNQLQFNLDVPLATRNLAVQFHRPSPIMVERVGGQSSLPGNVHPKQSTSAISQGRKEQSFNYSVLSEDKMEMVSQLARRDLHNQRLQEERSQSSPHRNAASTQGQRSGRTVKCQRSRNQRYPLRTKETDRNRRQGVRPGPSIIKPVKSKDVNSTLNTTQESDIYFPVRPVLPEGNSAAKDEITKLQNEIEGYLEMIRHIEERAIKEHSTKFLQPPVKGRNKDGYLAEEEDSFRARTRVEEQSVRSARNLYNLRQKVKQIQRDVAHADLSKPTKKSQIVAQLTATHRGAVRAIQLFVNQLPHQDLCSGLPPQYKELALLLRQLTALSSLARQGGAGGGLDGLTALLDNVDSLNAKWCAQLSQKETGDGESKVSRKPAPVTKEWVSDTRVDKNSLYRLDSAGNKGKAGQRQPQQQQQQQLRGRSEKRAPGKENRLAWAESERKAALRSGLSDLLGHKESQTKSENATKRQTGQVWEVNMGKHPKVQSHTKGYMLPSDLIAKREKAQRAVELSNQRKHFEEQTVSSRLRSASPRHGSAPTSPKRKGVNFDMDQKSPAPWIPAGSGSSASPRARARSLSPEGRERPCFYLRDVGKEEVRQMFTGKGSLLETGNRRKEAVSSYGFRSLPSERNLRSRSTEQTDSYLDELEDRLLERMKERRRERNQRPVSGDLTLEDLTRSRDDLQDDLTGEITDVDSAMDVTELEEGVRKEAVSLMDAPTLENIGLRLAEMQREQREIRQRWSSLHFRQTEPKSRIFRSSEIMNDRPRDPPAIEVTKATRLERPKLSGPVNKDSTEEPLIFTKPVSKQNIGYLHSVHPQDNLQQPVTFTPLQPPKKLVSLKQTVVERIGADRDRYESYLRRRSHHPLGKFNPWKLVEEISDEILAECLQEVSNEVERTNEEIANHMYKSEFMVTRSPSTGDQEIVLTLGEKGASEASEKILYRNREGLPVESNRSMEFGGGEGLGSMPFDLPHKSPVSATPEKQSPMISPVRRSPLMSPARQSSPRMSPVRHSPLLSPARLSPAVMSPSNLSPAMSPARLSPSQHSQQSPNRSAAEPDLDDVSNFVQKAQGGGDTERKELDNDEEYEDEEDESEEDEDDEDYSDDEFENVTDDNL